MCGLLVVGKIGFEMIRASGTSLGAPILPPPGAWRGENGRRLGEGRDNPAMWLSKCKGNCHWVLVPGVSVWTSCSSPTKWGWWPGVFTKLQFLQVLFSWVLSDLQMFFFQLLTFQIALTANILSIIHGFGVHAVFFLTHIKINRLLIFLKTHVRITWS